MQIKKQNEIISRIKDSVMYPSKIISQHFDETREFLKNMQYIYKEIPIDDLKNINNGDELIESIKRKGINPNVIKDLTLYELDQSIKLAEQLECSISNVIKDCSVFPDTPIKYDELVEFLQELKKEIIKQKRGRNIIKMAQDSINKEELKSNNKDSSDYESKKTKIEKLTKEGYSLKVIAQKMGYEYKSLTNNIMPDIYIDNHVKNFKELQQKL